MSWSYDGDGEEIPPGGRDATVWAWTLVSEDGSERRTVQVAISGTAMSSSNVPELVENARTSRGQTLIARVLDWAEPPTRISVHSISESPHYEGGDPGDEVRELNEAVDWFAERGLLLVFTARGIGTGPNPASGWTHSANVIDQEADELVLRVEAPTRLEAVRAAKAKWEAEHPEPPAPPPVATAEESPAGEARRRLREFRVHLVVSRTSDDPDAAWMAEAYDDELNLKAVAVQPTLDDLWLTIADDVLPDEERE